MESSPPPLDSPALQEPPSPPLLTSRDGYWRGTVPLLMLAGLCAYCNSICTPYHLDDAWIYDLKDVGEFMDSGLGRARPVLSVSILVNHFIHKNLHLGYHCTNLLIHILAGLTLFGVVHRTLVLPRWSETTRAAAPWLAFAVAFLWIVHPLDTQAVTYIIQRCESLMGLFFLLALYCSIRAWGATWPRCWLAAAILCGALGAGCKEVIAGLPVLVFLYDGTFVTGSYGRALRRRLLFYLALAVVTWAVLGFERYHAGKLRPDIRFGSQQYTRLDYLRTQAGVVLHYLKLSVYPVDQCFDFFGWPTAREPRDWVPQTCAIAVLGLITLVGLLFRWWIGFVGTWFFIVLAPTSSVVPIRDVAFEHRMYLPVIAVVAVAVALGWAVLWRLPAERRRIPAIGCLLLTGGTLTGLTLARNQDYGTSERLYGDVALKAPYCDRAFFNLAIDVLGNDQFDRAEQAARKSLELAPGDPMTLRLLGKLALFRGEHEQAVRLLQEGMPDADERTGPPLSLLGEALYERRDFKGAIEIYQEAIRLVPREEDYHLGLAVVLTEAGQKQEAAAAVKTALEIRPGVGNRNNTDARRLALREPIPAQLLPARRALFLARQVVLTDPDNPHFLDTFAIALAANDQFSEAADTARRALQIARTDHDRKDADLAHALEVRLRLYERRLPYSLETGRQP